MKAPSVRLRAKSGAANLGQGARYWQKLSEGDVKGLVMPWDDQIGALRRAGLTLGAIGRRIGKRRSYVQQRLLRIAARELGDE